MKLSAILVAGLLLAAPALACRPLVTDDCPVIERGSFQWEFGVMNYSESSTDTRNITNVVTYGWLPRTNLVAEFPYFTVRGSVQTLSGMGDICWIRKIIRSVSRSRWATILPTATRLKVSATARTTCSRTPF